MTELTNDELRNQIFELIKGLEECLHDQTNTKYMVRMVLQLREYTKILIERLETNA